MIIPNDPVYNHEAEQNIIGALIKDVSYSACREVLDTVNSEMFYINVHRMLFEEIKLMTEEKVTVDLITLTTRMDKRAVEYGGFVYVAEIVKNVVSISSIIAYSKIVKKDFVTRQIISISLNAIDNAPKADPTELIQHVQNAFGVLGKEQTGKALTHISEISERYVDLLEKRSQHQGIMGLETGFGDLDHALGGIVDDALIVLAGRPSMGKTLLAQKMCEYVGVFSQQNPVSFYSLEMGELQLYERFICGISNVPSKVLKSGDLEDYQWSQVIDAQEKLLNSKIFMCEEPSLSVGQIRAKTRRQIEQHGKQALIVVDYLGLMKKGKADRHDIAIGDITRSLKELAKEIQTPVLLLAQANRSADNKRPDMSCLKDSSCIEADADYIFFVHRDEVNNPDTELKGITELIIAKDRHGDANGTIYLEKSANGFNSVNQERIGQIHVEQQAKLNDKKKGFDWS
jgi:replicative DNA helicase